MSTPLVTCLCLTTAGRRGWLNRAVECFRAQSYSRRELLIVADSISDAEFLPHFAGITVIAASQRLNIGQKRNLGCEAAQNSDLIVNWDDDDFSAPHRLTSQVASIAVSQKAVTGFQLMKFTDGASWWQYPLPNGFVHGTSLCFTREWWKANPFLEVNIGEDAAFCETAAQAGQLAQCPDTNLMYATIHPGNTSKKNVDQPGWVKLPGYHWKG